MKSSQRYSGIPLRPDRLDDYFAALTRVFPDYAGVIEQLAAKTRRAHRGDLTGKPVLVSADLENWQPGDMSFKIIIRQNAGDELIVLELLVNGMCTETEVQIAEALGTQRALLWYSVGIPLRSFGTRFGLDCEVLARSLRDLGAGFADKATPMTSRKFIERLAASAEQLRPASPKIELAWNGTFGLILSFSGCIFYDTNGCRRFNDNTPRVTGVRATSVNNATTLAPPYMEIVCFRRAHDGTARPCTTSADAEEVAQLASRTATLAIWRS